MKSYGRNGVNDQLHVPAALPQGREPPVPIGLEAEWAQDVVWTLWRRDKLSSFRELNSGNLANRPSKEKTASET
jgi:hypothetical protein